MKNFKKTMALILCIVLSLGSLAYAEEAVLVSAPVNDYEGHWAEATIQKWLDAEKVSGYPDGSYKPDAKVTRAEFVKMVNGIIDFNEEAELTYKDVESGDWFYDFIGVAQAVGYIGGYSAEQFGPNDYITREQAASILSRVQYLDNNETAIERFNDNSNISAWAMGSVGAAADAGFISGYTDGSFKALNNLTRAEALVMIDNVLVNSKNYVVYDGTELKDTVIEGDLIIAKTVGEGDVYLTNLDIKGDIKVYGGGVDSVYINNIKIGKIIVDKENVRLVIDNGSQIEEINVLTEVILENKDGSVAKINVSGNNKVTLSGKFSEIIISGSSNLILKDAEIGVVVVVENPINITGSGSISKLEAKANGIKYESSIKIEDTILGEDVTDKPVAIDNGTGSSNGSGGGTGGSGGGDDSSQEELHEAMIRVIDVLNKDVKSELSADAQLEIIDSIIVNMNKYLQDNSHDYKKEAEFAYGKYKLMTEDQRKELKEVIYLKNSLLDLLNLKDFFFPEVEI